MYLCYIRDAYIYFLIALTIVFARLDFFTVMYYDFPVVVYMSTLTSAILQTAVLYYIAQYVTANNVTPLGKISSVT